MHTQLVDATSTNWDEVVSRIPHDIYHLRSYVQLSAKHEGGEAMAFLAEEDDQAMVIPLLVRPLPSGYETAAYQFDATCPRGYPGPVHGGQVDSRSEDFLNRAVVRFVEALQERGIISAFIRLHPLLGIPEDPLRRVGTIVYHAETVFIDLTKSQQELWAQMRSNHRRHINKARRDGYMARMDETWDAFDQFVAIYTETMARVDADEHWYLSKDYFEDLRLALGDALNLCVIEREGTVVAAGLFSVMCGMLDFLYGGTWNEYLHESPAKTMLHFAGTWGQERGLTVFHLGGSQAPDDSLMKFKLGFSPLQRPVQSWRIITDQSAYEGMKQRWLSLHDAETANSQFFPVYRA